MTPIRARGARPRVSRLSVELSFRTFRSVPSTSGLRAFLPVLCLVVLRVSRIAFRPMTDLRRVVPAPR